MQPSIFLTTLSLFVASASAERLVQNKGNVALLARAASALDDYDYLFAGNGAGKKDASIQGDDYLTYRLVSNTTAFQTSVASCGSACTQTKDCSFFNIYQEFNNALYDW